MTSLKMNPVLLLVDLQEDFLSAPGLEPGRDRIVERATALIRSCREASIPVIHVRTTVSHEDDRRMPHWKRADQWICEAGTLGHAPPEPLRALAGEPGIDKTFFSSFSNPQLAQELESRGADTVVIAGVHLHACVRQTALDAAERGFEVRIANDAVGSDDPVHGAITRRYLAERAVRFADVEELIAEFRGAVAHASDAAGLVEAAADRARSAFLRGHDSDSAMNKPMLERFASLLENQADEIAELMAHELGKPVSFGKMEVLRSAIMVRAIMKRFAISSDEPMESGVTVRRRPHGVVALITPWNNPVYIALGKIVPALLGGNAVVWKPAPLAAAISRSVLALLSDAGCPLDMVNLVEGGRDAAEALMSHPQVDAVSITGSSLAGSSAQEICARRRNPLQAELGGNNAAIVWSDSDLSHAAQQIVDGAFGMAGQRCTANRRVIVHRDVRDAFVEMLADATAALPCGDPFLPETRMGPMVSAGHCARVAALLKQCPPDKVQIMRPEPVNFAPLKSGHEATWHPAVIVCCEDSALDIVQEETFGPVLVVQTATNWNEAVRLCNGVRQGLAAAIFSMSTEIHKRFLDDAQAGILKINRSTADADVDVPFGGWKSSGIGPPEHGEFDRDFYTRPQTCYVGATGIPWLRPHAENKNI